MVQHLPRDLNLKIIGWKGAEISTKIGKLHTFTMDYCVRAM